jgi:aconitate hydratase
MVTLGGDPQRINPLVRTDLVIDHSVQVDFFGTSLAFERNVEREMERNGERYALLRWAQRAFSNFSVVPPGTGIVHQVNLEYLASVVRFEQDGRRAAEGQRGRGAARQGGSTAAGFSTALPTDRPTAGERIAYPDTLVGTDSHTTMINGLGVLGWGVGGIEAEAVMLGQPYFMALPEVVGLRLTGSLPTGATATDLVLTVTQMLRKHGVVDKFVEFYGPGLRTLGLADRATIANMAPEYGATMGFFPVDAETLRYLERTGRGRAATRVERYCRAQQLFHTAETPDPEYSSRLELDLSLVEPSLAGPRRPQDRVPLTEVKPSFLAALPSLVPPKSKRAAAGGGDPAVAAVRVNHEGQDFELRDGSVVIAAITSCTNTSNPSVMVGAGLLARNAVRRGLQRQPWVKTSMAPGSKVVTRYLEAADLMTDLEAIGFHVVGYGCTTCIGNSGPLAEPIAAAVADRDLVVAAVLSGNRNFEARIHPQVRANYLASPLLVVAYALAGRVDIDLDREPLGTDTHGHPVYLKDVWPTPEDVAGTMAEALKPEMFTEEYASVFDGTDAWKKLPVPSAAGGRFAWNPGSTYVANPPFFGDLEQEPRPLADIQGARVLAWLGDSVTTDHISPAGAIPKHGPAGRWLIERGVEPVDFNTFGSRRGHHEVMMRGTFGNIRIKNRLADGKEGNWTVHVPSGETMSIYDAAMRYQREGTPLVVLAGVEYGTGSSRDWAAKGTALLGVRAVIAQSYERIHRGNLIGMGVLPLQFAAGRSAADYHVTGRERFTITGIARGLKPGAHATVRAEAADGEVREFEVQVRLDTPIEVEYYRHGGIMPYVLRQLAK